MEAEAAGVLELLFPAFVLAIQFEVDEAGVMGEMPWGNELGNERYAGHLQVYELVQLLYGGDLALLLELPAQFFARQVGPHGQNEGGIFKQSALMQLSLIHI